MVTGGGPTKHHLILLVGEPGSGKTVLASQMVFHVVQTGASALILTTASESSTKLLTHLAGFTFYDPTLVGQRIMLLHMPTLLTGDVFADVGALARTIRDAQVAVVVIDGLQASVLPTTDAPILRTCWGR